MDIHKPKPWRGVQEFLKEYLIIVVGVLTALAAEAGVEWLHWRHQIEVAHEALAYDMKRVAAWGGLADAQTPCIGARLAELESVVDRAQETGRLPPLGPIANPERGAWALRAWSGLTYGQTLAHMPNGEQTRLAAIALYVDVINRDGAQQLADWSSLRRLSGPGRRTNDAEIADLRDVIARERGIAGGIRRGATYIETMVVQTRLLSRVEIEAAWKSGVDEAAQHAMCQPLPPPDQYPLVTDALNRPLTPPGAAHVDDLGVRGETLR